MQMGCLFSKETDESPPAALIPNNLLLTAELSSYDSACRRDPELQSFDTALQSRTNRVINTLAADVQLRSLSFDTLKEVTGSLLEMNQEVVNIILECKKDVWKDQELFNLVEEFFENSLQMLDFCMVLDGCLKRARDGQLIINIALQQFEAEGNGSLDDGKKYSRTLEELKNFKAAGHPFTEEFFQIFQSVYKQQISMLKKLQLRKSKINKKLKTAGTWRRVSCIIFASAFVALLICAVVAAAVAAPPVAAALAAATSVPLGSTGKWVDSLWRNYESELKRKKEVINTMWVETFIAIKDLDNIRVLVDQLEVQIESLLQNADFALRGDEAVKFGIEEIKKRLEAYTKNLEDLGNHIHCCSRDIRIARTLVVRKIMSQPT